MNKIYLSLLLGALTFTVKAQIPTSAPTPEKANYQLAARFSPKKIQKLVFFNRCRSALVKADQPILVCL